MASGGLVPVTERPLVPGRGRPDLTGKAVSSPLVTAFADSGQEPTGELRVLGQWLNSYILLEGAASCGWWISMPLTNG